MTLNGFPAPGNVVTAYWNLKAQVYLAAIGVSEIFHQLWDLLLESLGGKDGFAGGGELC